MGVDDLPVVLSIISILLVIGLVVCYIRWRRRKSQLGSRDNISNDNDEPGYTGLQLRDDSTSVNNAPLSDKRDRLSSTAIQGFDNAVEMEEANTYWPVMTPVSYPIPVSQLVERVDVLHQDNQAILKKYYAILPTGYIASCAVASKYPESNRLHGILAYDHSRIVVKSAAEEGGNPDGYINASYIKAYKDKPRGYIACQGPHTDNLPVFWQMIWQENVHCVVMLTDLVEAGEEQCDQYWPETGIQTYGDIQVSIKALEKFADYVIRTFEVSNKGKDRRLRHFQFTAWPHDTIPTSSSTLMEFHSKILAEDKPGTGPLLVHCSTGVGRTGALIAINHELKKSRKEGVVDVPQYIMLMRADRANMVDSLGLYGFIFDVLLEAALSVDTLLDSKTIHKDLKHLRESPKSGEPTKLEEQYRGLEKISQHMINKIREDPLYENRQSTAENQTGENGLPPSTSVISACLEGYDAIYVDSYLKRQAFIILGIPSSQKACANLWKIVAEKSISSMIVLGGLDSTDKLISSYWPTTIEAPMELPGLVISYIRETASDFDGIKMVDCTVADTSQLSVSSTGVKLICSQDWEADSSDAASVRLILDLSLLYTQLQENNTGPTIIMCKDGVAHSGIMAAALMIVETVKIQKKVNIFHIVKLIRRSQPDFIHNVEQYNFLHEVAHRHLMNYKIYANIP